MQIDLVNSRSTNCLGAEEEEEDQSCDGKSVSNKILKGQVRTAKSGRPSQKTEGNNESGRSYQVT